MRRILATAFTLTVAGLAFWAWPAEGGDGGRYLVRAIFDNASFVVPGEEVRVAGATVGVVESVDVSRPDDLVSLGPGGRRTEAGKAVIVLDITDGGFKDFRTDASCIIRPQSLIGERYVDCLPTQPRPAGTPPPPELPQVPDGESGEGERLLSIENNAKAVDLDLVQNVMSYPYRERFRIIINELGAGLAARGEDLNQVIRRGDPALLETNRVLQILARQRGDLDTLAENGNLVMEPLARERASLSGFIRNAAYAAQATAERRPALEEGIRKLPATLVQVRKTMKSLESLGRQGTPLMRNFKYVAPYLNVATKKLPQLVANDAGVDAITSLGEAMAVGNPPAGSLENSLTGAYSNGFLTDLTSLGDNLGVPPDTGSSFWNEYSVSTADELSRTFGTFNQTGGVKNLLDAVYNLGGAVNGYDSYGHNIRGIALITGCLNYEVEPYPGCGANWEDNSVATAAALARQLSGSGKPPRKLEQLPEISMPGDAEPPADSTTTTPSEGSSTPEVGQQTGPDEVMGGIGSDGRSVGVTRSEVVKQARRGVMRRLGRAETLLRYLMGMGVSR